MKAKSSIKTKADIERHLKRLAGEGSLIALTPKQAKSVKEFVESAEKIGYEQGKKEAFVLMQKALGNCYCGKYAKCPVVEKIKELSKDGKS